MTKEELIAFAKDNNVEIVTSWNKPEIEEAIVAAGKVLPSESVSSTSETTLKVELLRGYFPTSGAVNKLPAGEVVELPAKEAKGLVRKGVATFPLEDDEDDE